jgi:hypothetical protein
MSLMRNLRELAREALLEITTLDAVGSDAGETAEGDGVVSVLFDSALPGYPGWKWTVSIATLEGEEPSVLEVELMPSTGALLSPDWVPWSDRLADYEAAQDALAPAEVAPGALADDDDEEDDEEDDDEEDDDDEVLDGDVLHAGDVDGVDIDVLDDDGDDDDRNDEEEGVERSY